MLKHLGYFDNEPEAVWAYDKAVHRIVGSAAHTNFESHGERRDITQAAANGGRGRRSGRNMTIAEETTLSEMLMVLVLMT